jgi:hypothetical protein
VTTTAAKQARTLVSRAAIWAGLALGTFLTVLAVRNGIRVPRLEVVLSVLATWALLTVLAVVVAEMLRRHHRAIGRHAVRYGKQGAVATARHAHRHGGTALRWLVARAAPRWENRQHQPLMFRRHSRDPDSAAGDRGPEAPASAPLAANTDQPSPSTEGTPMALNLAGRHSGPGFPDHTFAECSPELCGEQRGALARQYASRIAPERRARRAAARSGGSIPSEWGPVIAQTADFEPEDDGELLEWMTRQVTGLGAWAEALVDFYEHCTGVVGIDPKASAMLHDVADAAAGAAETMGAAKARFTEHYELPREFAANGGLMTHDGRWISGEGA